MGKSGKKILAAFIVMACLAAGAIGVFYYISRPDDNLQEVTETGTEVEKLIKKDLDTKYPETAVWFFQGTISTKDLVVN